MKISKLIKDFVINSFGGCIIIPSKIRKIVYRIYGFEIAKSVHIKPGCYLGLGKGNLKVGEGCFVNYNCWFDLGDDIILGHNCDIAMNVVFMNSTHEIGGQERRAGYYTPKSISVGDGSWIGASTIIMPGVTIGEGCIIQAGSVVLKDCRPNCIYGGNPAELIMDLSKQFFEK